MWIYVALGYAVKGLLVAYFVPELWARLFWRRPWGCSHDNMLRVALTFDDGPDPHTTPSVLALLAQYNIPATFFVLGEKAAAYPEVLKQITLQGHEIGLHGYRHRHHWLLGHAVYADLRQAREIVSQLTHTAPRLFRPPWGMISLLTLRAIKKAEMQLALYDVESGDWTKASADKIARRVLKKVRPGSVILLHDAARNPERVAQTTEALKQIIPALRAQGYEFCRLSDMMRRKSSPSLLQRLWMAWERLFARWAGVLPVTESIHVLPYIYKGPEKPLSGQETLRPGDRCLEIHFHNEMLHRLPGDATARMRGLRICWYRDMGYLAQLLQTDPRFQDIKALTAITLFHQAAVRVGFHCEPLASPWRRKFFSLYMRLIKRIYQGEAASDTAREAKFVWIGRTEFLQKMQRASLPNGTPVSHGQNVQA